MKIARSGSPKIDYLPAMIGFSFPARRLFRSGWRLGIGSHSHVSVSPLEELLLDAAVFAANLNPVRDVMVGGKWVVQEGRHLEEEAILQGFQAALSL